MENVLPRLFVFAVTLNLAACATPGGSNNPAPAPAPPVGSATRVYRLSIGRVASVPLSNAEADRILAGATKVLRDRDSASDVGANVVLQRSGDVRVISGPGVVSSPEDRARIGASGVTIGIVDAIQFCSSGKPGVVGCTPIGGNYMVLVRQSRYEDIIWAHELGHMTGLNHRAGNDALMNVSAGASRRSLVSNEAGAFEKRRGGSGVAAIVSEATTSGDGPAPQSAGEFLNTLYIHGIPYSHVANFGPADAEKFKAVLRNPSLKSQWVNASVALAAVGTPDAVNHVRDFVAAGRGQLGHREYQAKLAAVVGLGYGARKANPAALDQLAKYTSTDAWKKEVHWTAPESSTNETEEKTLTSASFSGLAISGEKEAGDVLTAAVKHHAHVDRMKERAKAALDRFHEIRAKRLQDKSDPLVE